MRLADVAALVHVAGTLEVLRAYRGLPEKSAATVAKLTVLETLSAPTYRLSTEETAYGLTDASFLLQRRHTRLSTLHIHGLGGPALAAVVKACPLLHRVSIHKSAAGNGSGWTPPPIGWELLNDGDWIRQSFM